MRNGITIGFLAVLLIGSSTDVKDPSDDFYQNVLTRDLNKARRQSASNTNINNMHELILDQELCQRVRNVPNHIPDNRKIIFLLEQYSEQFFQKQIDDFLSKKEPEKETLIAGSYSNPTPVIGFECIVPAQKKVCCGEYFENRKVICLFGPERIDWKWWTVKKEGAPDYNCDEYYVGYNGLCTHVSRIPNFYNETLPSIFNEIRRIISIEKGIPNMYELVFDPKLCKNHTFSSDSRGIIFLNQFVDFVEQTNIFLEKETQMLDARIYFGVEYIIPAQKKVCCEQLNVTTIQCGFGPEGELDSWTNRQTDKPPGSKCDPCYENYKGLCRKESKKPIPLSTTIIDPNPERDAPHFYNKTLPSAFNDIRRITAIYERIPNMYELVYDPELCPDLNGGGLEKNLRFTYFKMSKFDCEFLLNDTETFLIKIKEKQVNIQEIKTSQAVVGFEYIIPGQKKVCCEENNSDVVCVFGPEGGFDSWINKTCGTPGSCGEGYKNNTGLCAPNSSSSDPSSFPNNSSIIHGTESSEVTRIPLVYLRPTENPDLEKRLKKYLAEETDGDEPSEEKDEEYYYDYDSATSISILVTVVFVCFLVLFYE